MDGGCCYCVDDRLLQDVKDALDVTWSAQDRKIRIIIQDGIERLTDKHGGTPDFKNPGLPRRLLFEFCRYVWSGALDAFEANYQHDIIAMQNNEVVRRNAQTT